MAPLMPLGSPALDLTSNTKRSGVVEPPPPAPTCTLPVVAEPAGCKVMLPVPDCIVVAAVEVVVPNVVVPVAPTVITSVPPLTETRNGFALEPAAPFKLNKYPVPVL